MRNFDETWRQRLSELDRQGRRRRLVDSARLADGRIDRGAGPLLDFSSNDYLGLSQHPALKRRAQEFAESWGVGAAASRLVTGNLPPFAAIEAKIAAGKQADAALLLVSGFQANASLLPALLDKTLWGAAPLLFADKLNHASLIQGCQAAGVPQIRFRHNDMDHLDHLLRRYRGDGGPRFIVTETVFSMDGDRADLPALVALAERHEAFLYLDEAHATGILGPSGFGLAHGLAGANCLVMGTFSKAMGSFGAYVVCSATLRDFLINRCAGLIYATALPPAMLGAIDAAIDLLPRLGPERHRVAEHAEHFRRAMRDAGEDCGLSSTHIVPVMKDRDSSALALAAALERRGILAMAIRPPTVPPGGSRLRFTFTAHHSSSDIDQLIAALAEARADA